MPNKTAEPVELNPATLRAFTDYMDAVEAELAEDRRASKPFFWSDSLPDGMRKALYTCPK